MIDWRLVGFSSLWILGLALVLAALSLADYDANQQRKRVRAVLREAGYQLTLNAALTLFCLGLLGSVRTWWELVLWVGLALAFAYQAGRASASLARRQRQKQPGEVGDDEQAGRREG